MDFPPNNLKKSIEISRGRNKSKKLDSYIQWEELLRNGKRENLKK